MSGSETHIEDGVPVIINETDVADSEIMEALMKQHPEFAVLEKWGSTSTRRPNGIFQRDRYINPKTIFDKFRVAHQAVEQDDVVSGVCETTEQLAFKRIAMECDDIDEQSVWNDVINDLDITNIMRQIWREIFICSQAYPAVIYGVRDYKVKGRTASGNKKKKQYNRVRVPIGISLLDPLKVVPVGNFMFGKERLAYIADADEVTLFGKALEGQDDVVLNQLIESKYKPNRVEAREINKLVGQSVSNRLFLLKEDSVWRITATRPDYQRFASVRMESVFELLDLKHQLREMDRAGILGTTNAIILVKKGDKDQPARPGEIEQLATQVKTSSRVPIIVGDHRIEIEIITPKTDKTLSPERYNGLDSRITSRLFQILSTGNYAAGTATDDSIKLLRVVAASMEARRDIVRDSLMTHVFTPAFEKNAQLFTEPEMQFYPRRIALDFDPTIAQFMQDLRDRGDISRETILAELDIIEENEAIKRQREAEYYDHIFQPTTVPYSANPGAGSGTEDPEDPESDIPQQSPQYVDTKTAGRRQGGRKNNGGRPQGS